MSFLSLLKLGSAMPKVKAMGRYNLAKQAVLPTFGPSKKTQPIVASLVAKAAEAKPPVMEAPVTVKPVASRPDPATAEAVKSVVAKLDARPSNVSKPVAKKSGFGLGWLGKSNPFAGPVNAPAPAQQAVSQPVAAKIEKSDRPVQPELCLDKVKVVRNDLSDADLEVVPSAVKKPKAPPGSTIPDKRYVRPNANPDQLGKKAWGMLGTRLFGAAAKHN